MEEVTIVIQGKIIKEAYDFYIKKYFNCKVIISTWVNTDIDFSNIPANFKIILSPVPDKAGDQNLNYQIVSTLAGLEAVTTKFAIKLRGDEYWSYPENIYEEIKLQPDKIHTSSVFFRAWDFAEYHFSDHIIAGKTENLMLLFKSAKFNVDNNRLNVSKWKIDGKFHKYIHTHSPEERLTKTYLEAKDPERFGKMDGRFLMKEHFNILNIELLKPYLIRANLFKKEWRDDFIPERNFSISTIDQLFSDEPYKIPNK